MADSSKPCWQPGLHCQTLPHLHARLLIAPSPHKRDPRSHPCSAQEKDRQKFGAAYGERYCLMQLVSRAEFEEELLRFQRQQQERRHGGHHSNTLGCCRHQLCQPPARQQRQRWRGHAALSGGCSCGLHDAWPAANAGGHDAAAWVRASKRHGPCAWGLANAAPRHGSRSPRAPLHAAASAGRGWHARPGMEWDDNALVGQHRCRPLHGAGGSPVPAADSSLHMLQLLGSLQAASCCLQGPSLTSRGGV